VTDGALRLHLLAGQLFRPTPTAPNVYRPDAMGDGARWVSLVDFDAVVPGLASGDAGGGRAAINPSDFRSASKNSSPRQPIPGDLGTGRSRTCRRGGFEHGFGSCKSTNYADAKHDSRLPANRKVIRWHLSTEPW